MASCVKTILGTLLRLFTGTWYDKKGLWSIIIVSAVLGFLSLVVLSYAPNNIGLITAAILFGAGYGTVMPCLQTWTVQKQVKKKVAQLMQPFFQF